MIDVQELEKLNRLRDKNINEKGIVDELVRMTFYDEEYEKSTYNYQNSNNIRTDGFYLRHKQTNDLHPFNLLFRICEKVYFKAFENKNNKQSVEECFEEDHRSQARLLLFEILCGANDSFNQSFNKAFNLDLRNIDDFKYILRDLELALQVRRYITRVIGNEAHKIAFRGHNADFILCQKKVNGKLEKYSKKINTLYLDKKFDDNESSNPYYDTLPIFIEDCIEELKQEDNLYKHILENINNILTKKQLSYLNAYLKNEDEEYLNTITTDKRNQQIYRNNYKRKIRQFIEEYLNRDLYTNKSNNKFELKKSLLSGLENILKQSSNKAIFTTLCSYLQTENNNALENVLVDIIYNLEYRYYSPITSYINSNSIDENYINNDFITVIDAIQSAYNHHARNNNIIYNLNRNNKELVVEDKIKKIMGYNKQGYVSRGKSSAYISISELKQFLEGVEGVKLTNKQVKEVLNKYGYDINLNATKKIMKKFIQYLF